VPDLLANWNDASAPGNEGLRQQIETALWRIAPEKTPKALVVEKSSPVVTNGVMTERLDMSIGTERNTMIEVGTVLPASRQSWTNDPRGSIRLFRVNDATGQEQFLGEFEVLGLPPTPEAVHAYVISGVADGNIFVCARDVNRNQLLDVRRVK
jgi:hypothetical protein